MASTEEHKVPDRAWAALTIKSVDDERRILEGIASTPNTDRMGDIVEPKGAKFTLPLPFLYQHNHDMPIGQVIAAKVTDAGINVRIQISKSVVPFIEEAWQLIKNGLVRGLSIGFRSIERSQIDDTWSYRFLKWDWYELSAVTIPANADASIISIKSFDEEQRRTALGAMTKSVTEHSSTPAGDSAKPSNKPTVSYKGTQQMATKTIQENIQDAENKRAANLARVQELAAKARDESRAMDDTENEEYDTLVAEIKTIDKDLVRQRELLELSKDAAKPLPTTDKGPDAATAARTDPAKGTSFSWGKSSLPKGRAFTRAAISMLRAKGDSFQALENAKVYKDSPEVEQAVKAMIYAKAAVAAGTTTDSTWAAPLVVYQNMASEFIELLRPATIMGKLTGVRNVPFNISIPRTTAGSTSAWVGEDDPKPVSRMSFDSITLGHNKIATIVVLSQELVEDSSPAAESLVQADMIAAVQQYSDQQFIDPTVAASGTIRPASITNGLTTHNMSGTAVANVLADMAGLMGGMVNGDIPFTNMYWIMHPRTALYLSMLLSPLGTLQFPNINVNGGTFLGFPVITSTAVPVDTGDDTYIILCNASEILVAESGMMVDVSREASLQMDSAPSDSAASLISLWQKNLVGLKVERRISYRRRRDAAVAVLRAVSY